ncbi:MAG: agmatinase [Parcubacteria group bacterium Gr01-1014_30]|nr:MAG: agmatinase [Parcubacteria group bacterium Gr01-1014_30]
MKTFLDLASLGLVDNVNFENADAVVVPFGYEGTVTFGRGASKGPASLIEASSQVETFDDELLDDIQNQIKIWTLKQPSLPKKPEAASSLLQKIVSELIQKNKLPVVVGGEHSISYGVAQGLSEHYRDISALVFDAHLDLGDQWSKKPFTHAAWLKYSFGLPSVKNAALVGIRNFNKLEYAFWQNNHDRVKVFLAKDRRGWSADEIVSSLDSNVYVSFDIDAFDSSVMPSTGTPEPGGLFWDDVLPILRQVCARKNVVGMDLVELAPIRGLRAPDFLAAKLLMKMILYKFCVTKLKVY